MKLYPLKATKIDDNQITYLEAGDESSEVPLLMLPGWPVSAISLLPLIQALETRTRCVALNLPGYGSSETDSRIYHGFDYYSKFILQFQSNILRADKINFFGHSTGGVHGLNFALKYPERIRKLIIFSPPFNGVKHMRKTTRENKRAIKLFNALKKHPKLLYLFYPKTVKYLLAKWLFRTVYNNRYPDIVNIDSDFIKTLLSDTCSFNSKAIFDTAVDITHREYDALAKDIKTDTLVIAGENDHAVAPEESKRLANLLPKGKFTEIPDAGHDAVITKPELVARQILDFIEL